MGENSGRKVRFVAQAGTQLRCPVHCLTYYALVVSWDSVQIMTADCQRKDLEAGPEFGFRGRYDVPSQKAI